MLSLTKVSPHVPFVGAPQFHNWLKTQGKTKATIRESMNYAKRFGTVLDTQDALPLLTLSPRNKQHAMSALANLSKFQGRYNVFLQIRQRYSLKWSKGDSLQYFERFFNEELTFDSMLQQIKEMMRLLPLFMARIIKFACIIGLRPSEVVECVRLLNSSNIRHYYNRERQALEHYRFPSIFLRQTKKAYVSFVTPEMLELVGNGSIYRGITYNDIRIACWSAGIKCNMRFGRKLFASWLRQEGIQPEIVDMLQGRVSPSVLTRHYLVPQSTFKDDVLQALEKLQRQLSS